MKHLEQLVNVFSTAFPGSSTTALEFVACEPNNDRDVGIRMRLVLRDGETVRGVREDVVDLMSRFDSRSLGRIRCFATALAKQIARIDAAILEQLGPRELLDFTPLAYTYNKTEADFLLAIATTRLGEHLPKQPALARLHAMLKEVFPAKSDTASIEYVDVHPGKKPGTYSMTVRLVVWDVRDQVMSIRDVKEQWVTLKLPVLDEVVFARLREFLPAFVDVAGRALRHPEIETLMPADLVDFSPLGLVKATSHADFITALSVPSRLGQYLTR